MPISPACTSCGSSTHLIGRQCNKCYSVFCFSCSRSQVLSQQPEDIPTTLHVGLCAGICNFCHELHTLAGLENGGLSTPRRNIVFFGASNVGASTLRERLERGTSEDLTAALAPPTRATGAAGGYELGLAVVTSMKGIPLCIGNKLRLAIWVMSGHLSRRQHALASAHMRDPNAVYCWIVDATNAETFEGYEEWKAVGFNRRPILVVNKCDALPIPNLDALISHAVNASGACSIIRLSSKTGDGILEFTNQLIDQANCKGPSESVSLASVSSEENKIASGLALDVALNEAFNAFSDHKSWSTHAEESAAMMLCVVRRLGRVSGGFKMTDERIVRLITTANLAAAVLREWSPAACFAKLDDSSMTAAEKACSAAAMALAIVMRFLRGVEESLLPDLHDLEDVLPRLIVHASSTRGRSAHVLKQSVMIAVFSWMRSGVRGGDVWKSDSWEMIRGVESGGLMVVELRNILEEGVVQRGGIR
jgi:hypothetical protein